MDNDSINNRENLDRLWQSVYFTKNDSGFDNVSKGAKEADAYRSLMFQLHYERASNNISQSFWEHYVGELMNKYSQVVDDQLGLNNYAEGALAIAAHRKNESSTWKSSLSELSRNELMTFLPEGSSLQEHVDDSVIDQLIDIFNTETKTDSVPSFQKSKSSETFSSGLYQNVFPPNEPGRSLADQAATSLNLHENHFHRATESYAGPSSCAVPQSALFSSVSSIESQGQYLGPPQKRKYDFNESSSDRTGDSSFRTAKEQFAVEQQKKPNRYSASDSTSSKKFLGSRRGLHSKFISPMNKQDDDKSPVVEDSDPKLRNIDAKMIEMITNEIIDDVQHVSWDDIAGLEFAKSTINEIVVWPLLRPDLFRGLRGPAKGILLFGPPGTGKTMIGKCIASQSKSTFFSISASSLTSKWIGDGEKMVRALFAVARCHLPAVVFIDEIDSLLSQRSDTEHESSRRLKTEFLVQLDGATTCNDESLLVVGATNRPQELDEAARRRLVKRLYIPLPDSTARKQIVTKLLSKDGQILSDEELETICEKTHGYSGADMTNLCKEASLGPIRSLKFQNIEHISTDQVRPIVLQDFLDALKQVRASVSDRDLEVYFNWNSQYGCLSVTR